MWTSRRGGGIGGRKGGGGSADTRAIEQVIAATTAPSILLRSSIAASRLINPVCRSALFGSSSEIARAAGSPRSYCMTRARSLV